MGKRREAHVGVVLAQQYAVLRPARKHTVRLVDTLGHKVVDKYTDICLIARKRELLAAERAECCIGAGHKALPCGLLITRGAVDLACEIESGHKLCLEGMLKLCGVEEVVLHGISGTVKLRIGERGHSRQCGNLNIHRHGRREAVHIIFGSILTLGFKEELVLCLVGKGDNLCFNRGAIARAYTLYLSVVERRLGKALTKYFARSGVGIYYVAVALLQLAHHIRQIAEKVAYRVAGLCGGLGKIDSAPVDTRGSARLHAVGSKAERAELLGDAVRCLLGDAAAFEGHTAYVHKPV